MMAAIYPDELKDITHIDEEALLPLREKGVRKITSAPSGLEGEGFPVKRAFAGLSTEEIDPFVHMDQMGSIHYEPGAAKGTPWHPHRGFETVTYMIDGAFEHHDSTGGGGLITDGDTQWMTAGSGILHIETPPLEKVITGGLFHGIQLWVNLPAKAKFADPKYQDIRGKSVAMISSKDEGAIARIIAGELLGEKGPGLTHTPINLLHASIQSNERLLLPWPKDFNCLVYVLSGKGSISSKDIEIGEGQSAVLGEGDYLLMKADRGESADEDSMEVLILGGRPIREPVAKYGPFVMNNMAEIKQAFEDYSSGKFGRPTT